MGMVNKCELTTNLELPNNRIDERNERSERSENDRMERNTRNESNESEASEASEARQAETLKKRKERKKKYPDNDMSYKNAKRRCERDTGTRPGCPGLARAVLDVQMLQVKAGGLKPLFFY